MAPASPVDSAEGAGPVERNVQSTRTSAGLVLVCTAQGQHAVDAVKSGSDDQALVTQSREGRVAVSMHVPVFPCSTPSNIWVAVKALNSCKLP